MASPLRLLKNFVIVGTQRTGSSAIAESIGLHPRIACGWEWTLPVPWCQKIRTAERALGGDFSALIRHHQEHMNNIFDSRKNWLGYRCLFSSSDKWIIHPRFSPGLFIDRLEHHVLWMRQRPDNHIIHVVRRDNVDWLKSMYAARKTKMYAGRSYPKGTKVRVPVKRAIARVRSKDWVDYRLSSLAKTNPYLQVNYEEFLRYEDAVTTLTLRFLQCEPTKCTTDQRRLRKQSKGPASDFILNYEELFTSLEKVGLLRSRFDYRLHSGQGH